MTVVVVSRVSVPNRNHTRAFPPFVQQQAGQSAVDFHVYFAGPVFLFEIDYVRADLLQLGVMRGQMKDDARLLEGFQGCERDLFEAANSYPVRAMSNNFLRLFMSKFPFAVDSSLVFGLRKAGTYIGPCDSIFRRLGA